MQFGRSVRIYSVNGILIIDKPAGITSHDVVSRVRRSLGTKRVGHTGTLDPFATGVMVVLVGQATRLAQFLDKDVKEYEAIVNFGTETDTGDRTGRPISSASDSGYPRIEDVRAALSDLRGEIVQVPPMYSAKKIGGKKLYEYARKGETVERRSVRVTIYELEIESDRARPDPVSHIHLRVVCSAGTYIRTLAEDIGRRAGVGAHLAELRRTSAGKFTIEQSSTLEALAELDDLASALIDMNEAVSHLQTITLNEDRITKTRNGLSTRIVGEAFSDGEAVRMTNANGGLIAIGSYVSSESAVQPRAVLV